MPRVTVRYFAVLRDRRALPEEVVDAPATARQLADALITNHQLGLPSALVRIAVNGAFVEDDHPLREGDSVVLIPPVAGG